MIKNYTSTVPPVRSIAHIEQSLVVHGAKNIMKMYDPDGRLTGLAFIMNVSGRDMPFLLRAELDRVEAKLKKSVRRPRTGTIQKIKLQAERTAWKIIYDEVDIKMSRIDLDQIELLEAFLSNVYDASKQQTFFDRIKSGNLKLLGE